MFPNQRTKQILVGAYEDRLKALATKLTKSETLFCLNCNTKTKFRSTGLGGALSAKGLRNVQIQCLNIRDSTTALKCGTKVMLKNMIESIRRANSPNENYLQFIEDYDALMREVNVSLEPNKADNPSIANQRPTNQIGAPQVDSGPIDSFVRKRSRSDISIGSDDKGIDIYNPEIMKLRNIIERKDQIIYEKDLEIDTLKNKLKEFQEINDMRFEKIEKQIKNIQNEENINKKRTKEEKIIQKIDLDGDRANMTKEGDPLEMVMTPEERQNKQESKDERPLFSQVLQKSINPPRILQKKKRAINIAAKKSLAPRGEPVEFEKIQIQLESTSQMRKTKNNKEKIALIWAMTRIMGIRKSVFEVSYIGNSIIEMYVVKNDKDMISTMLKIRKIRIVEVDPFENPSFKDQAPLTDKNQEIAVRRLAFLYHRANLVNLKACIIQDLKSEYVERIKNSTNIDQLAVELVQSESNNDNMIIQ